MGIRFDCPNGHQLHVKAFLAGRRGICPDCGAKLIIPELSAQREVDPADAPTEIHVEHTVATTNSRRRAAAQRRGRLGRRSAAASQPGRAVATAVPDGNPTAVAEAVPRAAAPADPTTNPPSETPAETVWYVRPPAGGQYGPADDATLRQWIHELRIVPDTYLWHSGWAEWQRAGDVRQHLPAPLSANVAATEPLTSSPITAATATVAPATVAPVDESATHPTPTTVADVRRARRRSAKRQWMAAILLLALVVVLSGILIWVLRRDVSPPATARLLPAATIFDAARVPCEHVLA
jgi:hypothetical protein